MIRLLQVAGRAARAQLSSCTAGDGRPSRGPAAATVTVIPRAGPGPARDRHGAVTVTVPRPPRPGQALPQ